MAWDDIKQPNDDFPSSEWNNMVTDQKSRAKLLTVEEGTGSDCTGNDGETNRVYTLSNTEKTILLQVFVEGRIISPSNMNIEHKTSGTTIEFINKLWDADTIIIYPYA